MAAACEGCVRKNGAPPRNPNVRKVVTQLIAMGEFEQSTAQGSQDAQMG